MALLLSELRARAGRFGANALSLGDVREAVCSVDQRWVLAALRQVVIFLKTKFHIIKAATALDLDPSLSIPSLNSIA